MINSVDITALDPEARRLAERGAREAFGMSLDRLLDDFAISGTEFDEQDLETLILAGRLAEKADRQDASNPSRPRVGMPGVLAGPQTTP